MTPATVPHLATDNLALLYQGLLTSVVRVRSGAQPIQDPEEFRRRISEAIAGIEREAIHLGYPETDVRNANYAVVAFLDETILSSSDPSRQRWVPLQSELYGNARAGESFFDNLDALSRRRESPQLADILEVYYLCLLLGYKGRYADYASERIAELRQKTEDLKAQIAHARGDWSALSPRPLPPVLLPSFKPKAGTDSSLKWSTVAFVVGLVLLWVLCKVLLSVHSASAGSSLV